VVGFVVAYFVFTIGVRTTQSNPAPEEPAEQPAA
jgi:hypothetical protein